MAMLYTGMHFQVKYEKKYPQITKKKKKKKNFDSNTEN